MDVQESTVVVIAFLLILLVVRGYALDLDPLGAFYSFFSQPRAFLVYAIILIFGLETFLKWLPSSVWMFVAGIILFLTAKSGVA